MHETRQVEEILARLMPTALSGGCQADIELMIDDLAASSAASKSVRPWWKRWGLGGIAAAGMAAALIIQGGRSLPYPRTGPSAVAELPGLVLMAERNRVESMSDEGWVEDFDGSAMRAMRLSVVEENTLRDEETGIVMNISEPREEVLLMPVSTF